MYTRNRVIFFLSLALFLLYESLFWMIGELNAEFLKKGDCSSLLLLAYTIWNIFMR